MEELMNVPGLEGQSRGLTLWMVVRRGLERWRGPRGCCGRDRTRGLATFKVGREEGAREGAKNREGTTNLRNAVRFTFSNPKDNY
jgi:hypothetical protein